jgi:hypothetical protein
MRAGTSSLSASVTPASPGRATSGIMDACRLTAARPIHFFCWDCGAPLTLTVDALKRGGLDPSCPVCDSLRIGADYESLVKWFDACGAAGCASGESPRLRPARD